MANSMPEALRRRKRGAEAWTVGEPVISAETKKKELVGNVANGPRMGAEGTPPAV